MDQLSFLTELVPKEMEAPRPPTVWEKLAAGTKDFNWQEEQARILETRRKMEK